MAEHYQVAVNVKLTSGGRWRKGCPCEYSHPHMNVHKDEKDIEKGFQWHQVVSSAEGKTYEMKNIFNSYKLSGLHNPKLSLLKLHHTIIYDLMDLYITKQRNEKKNTLYQKYLVRSVRSHIEYE